MYLSVISSRTTEYATFFQQQSYQSATSIADMVIAGLNDRTLASGDNDLFSVMKKLNPGETVSTGANDFAGSFATDGTVGETEAERLKQLGAYSVDITRLPNETVGGENNMTYDIAVVSKVNGASEVVHTYVHLPLAQPSYPSVEMDVFASTGYVPNDSYLDGGIYVTDVFYDTEFTFMNMLAHGGQQRFIGDMKAGGSVMADGYMNPTTSFDTANFGDYVRPTNWYIRGDFTNNFSGGLQLYPGSQIMVGGDFSHIGGGSAANLTEGAGYIDIYVLGDLNITNGANYNNIRLHVNGDINIENKGGYPSFTNCQVFLNGNLNLTGFDIWNEQHIKDLINPQSWNGNPNAIKKVDQIVEELSKATETKSFSKWHIDDSTISDEITIKLNNGNSEVDGVPGDKTTFIIAYPGSESAAIADEVTSSAKIVGFKGTDTKWSQKAIIIDTGESEDNVMTLVAQPYIDMDGDGENETFAWTPNVSQSSSLAVLVKGRGQVIIDIPEGVTYQSNSRSTVMHYSWFMTLGGKKTDCTMPAYQKGKGWVTVNSAKYDSSKLTQGAIGTATDTLDLIHDRCEDDCAECAGQYYEEKSKKPCGYCKELIDKGELDLKEEDILMIDVMCPHHGRVKTYCPNENCKSRVDTDPDDFKDWAGLCERRFDRTLFDQLLLTNGALKNSILYTKVDEDGNKSMDIVYPKTDIFLVCANESSDIRFGTPIKGGEMLFNSFYGFIYAPYMSFKSIGGEGKAFRFMGALVVSDYIIQSGLPISSCYPEKMPSDFTGGDELDGVPKNWKLNFSSH